MRGPLAGRQASSSEYTTSEWSHTGRSPRSSHPGGHSRWDAPAVGTVLVLSGCESPLEANHRLLIVGEIVTPAILPGHDRPRDLPDVGRVQRSAGAHGAPRDRERSRSPFGSVTFLLAQPRRFVLGRRRANPYRLMRSRRSFSSLFASDSRKAPTTCASSGSARVRSNEAW
jgi:hypothetical protein